MVWRFLSLYLVIVNGLWAASNEALMGHLRSRMIKMNQGSLIKSYENHSQSYVYDQALAIIAFSKNGEYKSARELLVGLNKLQLKDGSLYFSYNLDGSSIYPIEGDKRFAGAIAWVAIAASTYQAESKSNEFKNFNYKILSYLKSQMKNVKGKDFKGVVFSPSDIETTQWNEFETIALEHNIDSYSAFRNFDLINKSSSFNSEKIHLEKLVDALWDKRRKHFWSGINATSGIINKQEYYLDNQTWTLLALDAKHLEKYDFKTALKQNCKNLFTTENDKIGFYDSKPTRRPASHKFIWSEGSAGQILAQNAIQMNQCEDFNLTQGITSISKMKQKDGGIAYASNRNHPDFSADSSIAGTTWFYFAKNKINPFAI